MIVFKKKGVGLIISWVLLLGFSIALAVSIFSWWRIQTEENIKGTIGMVEGALECEQVSIGVQKTCIVDTISSLTVTNTGKLIINALILRELEPSEDSLRPPDYDLVPKAGQGTSSTTIGSPFGGSATKIEVIPLLRKDTKYHMCSEKKIVLTCP